MPIVNNKSFSAFYLSFKVFRQHLRQSVPVRTLVLMLDLRRFCVYSFFLENVFFSIKLFDEKYSDLTLIQKNQNHHCAYSVYAVFYRCRYEQESVNAPLIQYLQDTPRCRKIQNFGQIQEYLFNAREIILSGDMNCITAFHFEIPH